MSPIPYSPFTEPQSAYIIRSLDSWLNVAEGGKRAGKNVINLVAWAACLETHPDRLHLAAGVSQSSAKLNIIDSDGFGLQWIFAGRCHNGQYMGRDALFIRTSVGEKVVIIAGGNDAGSARLIKGHSYGTAYITEVNECNQTFVFEVMDRTLASTKRQLFFDLNPKAPAHWFYSEFLDYQDKLRRAGKNPRYNYGHFTIGDNLSIPDAALHDELSKFDPASVWYQRDILGLRTSASGRVYTSYNYDEVAVSREWIRQQKFFELSIGVDVGGTDATAATLTGVTRGFEYIVHIDGLYHKQGISDKMTEAAYAKMVAEWLVPWTKIYPAIGTVYVDSANKLFRAALNQELIARGLNRFVVRGFDKSDGILSRIELSSMLLMQGRYKIAEHMKKWHEAYQMATWQPDDYAKGEWVRVDDGSYPVDCLDSAEYSMYNFRRYFIK